MRPSYDTTERVKQIEKEFDQENVARNLKGNAILKTAWLRDYPETLLKSHPEFSEIVKTDKILRKLEMNGDEVQNKFLKDI